MRRLVKELDQDDARHGTCTQFGHLRRLLTSQRQGFAVLSE